MNGRNKFLIAICTIFLCSACNVSEEDEENLPAQLDVTPQSFTFDGVAIGETALQTFTLTNNKNSPGTLKISDIKLMESEMDSIRELTPQTGWPTQATLAPGESIDLNVQWTPKNKLDDSGFIVIESNDSTNKTVKIAITTKEPSGEASRLESSAPKYLFENAGKGKTDEQTLTFTLNGDEQVAITSLVLEGESAADLKITSTHDLPKTINKAEDFDVTLSLTPTSFDFKGAKLIVGYDGGELVVPIEANVSKVIFDNEIDFGPVTINTPSSKVIYVENTSGATWDVGEVYLPEETGTGVFVFSFPDPSDISDPTKDKGKANWPDVIMDGEKMPIRITFTPMDNVMYSARLVFAGMPAPTMFEIKIIGMGEK